MLQALSRILWYGIQLTALAAAYGLATASAMIWLFLTEEHQARFDAAFGIYRQV